MIHVLYVAGAFGATIEYCIKRFSKELSTPKIEISADGGLHDYHRECYLPSESMFRSISPNTTVTTVVYPNHNWKPASDTITEFIQSISVTDPVIFVTMPELRQVIRNRVFFYYKKNLTESMPILSATSGKWSNWNPRYTSVDDMERWEQREMLSLEFHHFDDVRQASALAKSSWLLLTTDDFLNNFEATIKRILNYLGLTLDCQHELRSFSEEWSQKQQYMVDHYELLERIVESATNGADINWNTLDLVSEALIQYMLNKRGYDLKCSGLNNFPIDSAALRRYLIKYD